jgi:glycolate oxidase FAD binding subunit
MKYQIAQLSEQVLEARANFRSVLIHGGHTKSFYGNPFVRSGDEAISLDMRSLYGILNYEPTELVITALAGTPLQEITDTLDASGQMLAFDPPAFGPQATFGGCIASGLSGPARLGGGPLKDYVLGCHLLDAQGRVLKFGGEVMKNVAGYDVSRMLAGSMGMFGALLQISVKVAPKPIQTVTLEWECTEAESLAMCHGLRAHPLPVSASAWELVGHRGRLRIRLAGAPAAIETARNKLGGELLSDLASAQYWQDLREQRLSFFSTPQLWRVAVAPATPALNLGPTLIEWGGGQRWIAADLDPQMVRRAAEQAQGHATLFRMGAGREAPEQGVFHPLSPAVSTIVKRLKQEFDPKGVFNPGRLVAGI